MYTVYIIYVQYTQIYTVCKYYFFQCGKLSEIFELTLLRSLIGFQFVKTMKKYYKVTAIMMFYLLLSGCLGMPDAVKPVDGFQVDKYLGKWYEIARLDHSFEKGLSHVSAEYSRRKDGGIAVLNKGYNAKKGRWKSAQGKAYFVENEDRAYLKVSFFGPFYGSYVVFGLDQDNYQYAFVAGPKTSYLWFLSRKPIVTETLKQQFINESRQLGFKTEELIWVEHNGVN